MRYLGLDLGTKTLGISITDNSGLIARPLCVLRFDSEDYNSVIPKLQEIITTNGVDKIVLGLPKNMDGTIGFAGKRSLNFQDLLMEYGIEVELMDERLSTKSAIDIVHLNNDNYKNSKEKIDAVAACVILESYLKGVK